MLSWGNYPKVSHTAVEDFIWRDQSLVLSNSHSMLPRGLGRSYGDSCLNENNILLATRSLNRFMAFDSQKGVLRCEAGVTLEEILKLIVPHKWFLPVLPGTQFVTIGGAVANDIHGKNHHRVGTFGQHVLQFALLRSDGQIWICSAQQNFDLYQATIGGLGLTGLLLWVEIQLIPITSPYLFSESIKFSHLTEVLTLFDQSDTSFDYTVAWLDCLNVDSHNVRGILMRANHVDTPQKELERNKKFKLMVPFYLPSFTLNSYFMQSFNSWYFHRKKQLITSKIEHYQSFFFPLDNVAHWNRLYGKRGFLQYQCVIPQQHVAQGLPLLLEKIGSSRQGSFLSVLKKFGSITSPGMLSFPKEGVTLALDFPNRGEKTFQLLNQLDEIVLRYDGGVYPAKDARMSADAFQTFFPNWKNFVNYVDPYFSSSFWRRVTKK